MKLSVNSWHRKLYNLTYPYPVPKSLCPYFWLVVLACILFIPLGLFVSPFLISKYLANHRGRNYLLHGETIFTSILVNSAVVLTTAVVLMWFTNNKTVINVGYAGIIIGIFIGVMTIIFRSLDVREKKRAASGYYYKKYEKLKNKKPNLLVAYLKARKEKLCPILEWE